MTSDKLVSQNSLNRLSDYFSHLVSKGVINRTLLKLILYTQYNNNFDTSKVIRRNSNIGITTQKNKHNSIHHVKSNLFNNVVLPRHCFSMVLKDDENVVFRKKLLFTPQQPKAYQDLTKSILYVHDNYDYQQNLFNYNFNIPNFKSKHLTIPLQSTDNKDEIYLSDNQNSIYFLGDFKMPHLNDICNNENNTVLSQDFQYFKSKDQNSLRSYDSGLADITVTQKLPLSKTDTSLNSSEYLCKCTLPIHINSCTFEVECLDKKSISSDKNNTYRSSLYAHWWLKKSI